MLLCSVYVLILYVRDIVPPSGRLGTRTVNSSRGLWAQHRWLERCVCVYIPVCVSVSFYVCVCVGLAQTV